MKNYKVITKEMVNGQFCVESIKRTVNEKNHKEFDIIVNGKIMHVVVEGDKYGTTYRNTTRGLEHKTLNPIDENYDNLTNSFKIIDAEEDLMEKGYGEKYEGSALREAIVNNYLMFVAEDLKRSVENLNTSTTEEAKKMYLTMIRNGNNAIYELLEDYEDIDFEYVAENVQCYDGKTLYNFIRFYDKELQEEKEEMLDPDFILKMVRKAYPDYNKKVA